MKLYDDLISEALGLLAPLGLTELPVGKDLAAREGDPNELILKRDTAFELGEGSYPSVSITAVTQSEALVPKDGVVLCGADLDRIKGDCAYARVTLLRTNDILEKGEQAAYARIKRLETQKFRVGAEGYMMRPSAMTNREQVRVSRKAVKSGLRFQGVGNLLVQAYHRDPHVRAVQVIFVTAPQAPYRALDTLADQIAVRTKMLDHALADVSMNCRACEWKPVCDAVEGMKELHQQQMNKEETQ